MTLKLDQVLVIDIEATCWEGKPPPGQVSEIIEIGLCVLDIESGERMEKRSLIIKPTRSVVSEFCTKLTTLTQAQVDGGISFAEACAILRSQYRSRERVWASYGNYDRRMFEHQCRAEVIPYPFGPSHVNVKTLFALVHRLPHEVGMRDALAMIHLPMEGKHHRGGDDAWNIAAILSPLLFGAQATAPPEL